MNYRAIIGGLNDCIALEGGNAWRMPFGPGGGRTLLFSQDSDLMAAAYWPERKTLVIRNLDNILHCLSLPTGRSKWEYRSKRPLSGHGIWRNAGMVVVQSDVGVRIALDSGEVTECDSNSSRACGNGIISMMRGAVVYFEYPHSMPVRLQGDPLVRFAVEMERCLLIESLCSKDTILSVHDRHNGALLNQMHLADCSFLLGMVSRNERAVTIAGHRPAGELGFWLFDGCSVSLIGAGNGSDFGALSTHGLYYISNSGVAQPLPTLPDHGPVYFN